jgi:hypothetical protein
MYNTPVDNEGGTRAELLLLQIVWQDYDNYYPQLFTQWDARKIEPVITCLDAIKKYSVY